MMFLKVLHFFLKNFSLNIFLGKFIWLADEADESTITGTRITKPKEKTFFADKIGADNRTFFDQCCMVTYISATNIASMLSAKSFGDERRLRQVSPICTNTILEVGNTYVGYSATMRRSIKITPLDFDFYENGHLSFEKLFNRHIVPSLSIIDIDRVNRHVGENSMKLQVPYKSVLINTTKTRHTNSYQNTLAKTINNTLAQIQTDRRRTRFNYVVFTYNLGTKKGSSDAKLYSNSRVILSGINQRINEAEQSITINESKLSTIYDKIFTLAEEDFDPVIVVTVSGNMASRGINCKPSDHRYPLTDMYYESSPIDKKNVHHYESLIQEIGRLCSRDKYIIDRSLYIRDVKRINNEIPNDDFTHVTNALKTYDFYYKMFDFHQRSEELRFKPLSFTELLLKYSTHLRLSGTEEENVLCNWYLRESNDINENLTRKSIMSQCKRRLNTTCEEEHQKRQRLEENEEEPLPRQHRQPDDVMLPSVQFREAFERDLRMLAHEANEPRFTNEQDPLEAALSQFITSIGSNDRTWKTLAKHLIIKSNNEYIVKPLNEWTAFDRQKSNITKESFFQSLRYFNQGNGNTWRSDVSYGQIIVKNDNLFKLSWHA